jgi:hypothetical protein
MPQDERQLRVWELAVDDVEIRAADAARPDTEKNLPGTCVRLGELTLDERPPGLLQHHRTHRLAPYGPVTAKTTVLIDARNVLRSQWPNLPEEELVSKATDWARRNGHEVVLVFDGKAPGGIVGSERRDSITTLVGTGGDSADDWLIREAPGYPGAWLVTSDRALRDAAGAHASKLVGGGSFLRQLGE